jgi:hypothetical protein
MQINLQCGVRWSIFFSCEKLSIDVVRFSGEKKNLCVGDLCEVRIEAVWCGV